MEWDKYRSTLEGALKDFVFNPELVDVIRRSKEHTIFTCGNGGSASIASHFAADLSKGANKEYHIDGPRYKSYCLCDAVPEVLAIANDIGYSQIFRQQLVNLAKPRDILFAISSSGNSENIINAVDYANQNGLVTIGLTGFQGGKLKEIAQYSCHVNTKLYEVAEDVHHVFCHYIVQTLRDD